MCRRKLKAAAGSHLDIPVRDAEAVAVLDSGHQLLEERPRRFLGHAATLQETALSSASKGGPRTVLVTHFHQTQPRRGRQTTPRSSAQLFFCHGTLSTLCDGLPAVDQYFSQIHNPFTSFLASGRHASGGRSCTPGGRSGTRRSGSGPRRRRAPARLPGSWASGMPPVRMASTKPAFSAWNLCAVLLQSTGLMVSACRCSYQH